jgi:hypothetical protein
MGRIGLFGALALLTLAGWDAPPEQQDSMVVRCYAPDLRGKVFYSSAAFPGEQSHLDGDYLAFTAALRHRFHVDVDEDAGSCVAADDEQAVKTRIEVDWAGYRDLKARRVDTAWKPDRAKD